MQLRVELPHLTVRKLGTGAQPPNPGSRSGSTGTPNHSFRCPDEVWGAAVNAAAARGVEWGPVLRGYAAAFARGVAPVFADPLGGITGAEADDRDDDVPQ